MKLSSRAENESYKNAIVWCGHFSRVLICKLEVIFVKFIENSGNLTTAGTSTLSIAKIFVFDREFLEIMAGKKCAQMTSNFSFLFHQVIIIGVRQQP